MNETVGTLLQQEFNLNPKKVRDFDAAFDKFVNAKVTAMFSRLRASIFENIERKFKGPSEFPTKADQDFHNKMRAGNTQVRRKNKKSFAEFRAQKKMETCT